MKISKIINYRSSSTYMICILFVSILAFSTLQSMTITAQSPQVEIQQVFWGTASDETQAKPGDKNALLNIELRNIGTANISTTTAKLYLDNAPFIAPTGKQYAYAGVSSISAGTSATFTFRLNIDDDAILKTYELTVDITMVTVNYPNGITVIEKVSIPLLGEVRFSPSLNSNNIQLGLNDIALMLVNEGEATATDLEVNVIVPSPLVVVGENLLSQFSVAEPSEDLSINMELYAPSASVGNAYTITSTLTYSDGYGYAKVENVTVGVIVLPKASSFVNIESYAFSPDTVYKGGIFDLVLELSNPGDFEAEEVTVELTTPNLFASITPSVVSLG
ncbi:MAG: CARDB domain-containing protein, partial [Candidatus Bathyarchaeota archaeon]